MQGSNALFMQGWHWPSWLLIFWSWPLHEGCICLTHCGLVTPYGDMELGEHRLRQWLAAWRHQAITWTKVDLSSVRSHGINLRALSLFRNSKITIIVCRLRGDRYRVLHEQIDEELLKFVEEFIIHYDMTSQQGSQPKLLCPEYNSTVPSICIKYWFHIAN